MGNLSLTIVTTLAQSGSGLLMGVAPGQAEDLAVSYVSSKSQYPHGNVSSTCSANSATMCLCLYDVYCMASQRLATCMTVHGPACSNNLHCYVWRTM